MCFFLWFADSPAVSRSFNQAEGRHILVRSRAGGFVSWDCEACGTPRYVSRTELPAIACDRCGTSLVPGKNAMGNYAYRCPRCVRLVELADLVPRWEDLFDFHGLSIDPDYGKAVDRT
jgi:DNA-directed RNA polymerase subunit RPC12/RpoP